jgi:hypothetical protein
MSAELRLLEQQLLRLCNQVAHMQERDRATLQNEVERLRRALDGTDIQQISERVKRYPETSQVGPTSPERQHSTKRRVARLYTIGELGKLAASASRLPRLSFRRPEPAFSSTCSCRKPTARR